MKNLPLTEEEMKLFERYLDNLRKLTKIRLAKKGYTIELPSFDVVYQNVVEEVNSIIQRTYDDDDLKHMFSFVLYCSRKLTNEESIEVNVHAMAVDVYRCLGGKI